MTPTPQTGSATAGRGIACLIVATMIFAAQDALTKHLATSYPVPLIVMVRFWAFAAFAIIVASRRAGGIRNGVKSRRPFIQCLRGLLLVAEIGAMAYAFRYMGLADVQAMFSIYPLLVTALAIPILGERVGWRRWTATFVGFAGLLVILRPGFGVMEFAALVAIASALGYALYNVLTRLVSQDDGAGTTFLYTGVVGALAVSCVGPFYWVPIAPVDWGWLGLLALTGVLAHFLLIKALELASASTLQPFNYFLLIWSVMVGYIVFGDIPDGWTFLGAAIIVASGLYVFSRERTLKGE